MARGVGDDEGGERLTRRWRWTRPGRPSSLVSQTHTERRSVGIDGRGPGGRAGREGGQTARGRERLSRAAGGRGEYKGLASPSHLFLPLRQLVHARAPRLGMWAEPERALAAAEAESWGEAMSDRAPLKEVLKLVVRRRLPLGWSS